MDIERARKRTGLLVVGIIFVVVGSVWTGQGAGLIAGSFMTGQRMWLVIGAATAVLGLGLMAWSRRPGPPPRS